MQQQKKIRDKGFKSSRIGFKSQLKKNLLKENYLNLQDKGSEFLKEKSEDFGENAKGFESLTKGFESPSVNLK